MNLSKEQLEQRLYEATLPVLPKNKGCRIGIVGAGFIVRECHLVAYRKAGFTPYAITSLDLDQAKEVAKLHGLDTVYADWHELVDDPKVEILDIAVPPHVQPEIVRYACTKKHIKGILCQKPIAMSVADAREIVRFGREAGIPIAVNSNMRYDQSMRALKYALDEGLLGERVIATIDMRAIPDWQTFLKDYHKLELYSMGIHHIDIFRFLFGDPDRITALCRTDPRTQFDHFDGITQYTYQYADGMLASSLDDVWAWPDEKCQKNNYIRWRVEGTKGYAEGEIGWHKRAPEFCGSTMRLTSASYPGTWIEPHWDTQWFPDAFVGTMAGLLCAVENGTEPEINAEDNVKTLACVEACYLSIQEKRTVSLKEVL